MRCTNCGTEILGNAKFCPECGQKVVIRQQVCPNCGNIVNGGKFCSECGASLNNNFSANLDQIDDDSWSAEAVDESKTDNETPVDHDKMIKLARSYVIREMYQQAEEIYNKILEDYPEDMEVYMGYVRIATNNYTKYESEDINKSIRIAQRISGTKDLSEFDPQYGAYLISRKQHFDQKKADSARKASLSIGDFKNIGGGYVTFGSYPQSLKSDDVQIGEVYDTENGYYIGSDNCLYDEWEGNYYKVEPIKWRILSKEDDELFIASDNILDAHRFGTYNNYKYSDIREWLNKEFYDKAFRDKQRKKISLTAIDNDNIDSSEDDDEYLWDAVVLLSKDDLGGISYEDIKRVPTEYAVARGVELRTDRTEPEVTVYLEGLFKNKKRYVYKEVDNSIYRKNGKKCGNWWLKTIEGEGAFKYLWYVCDTGAYDSAEIDRGGSDEWYGVVPALNIKP